MLFTTIQFWAAFVAFLFLFALLRKTKREVLQLYVIAASLGFFYLSNHWLMLLLPATALVSWMLTEWMSEAKGAARKCLLFLIVTLDLLPLLFFKYSHSLSELLNQMLLTNFSLPSIALPIGISFYTFQAISYSVDVFRRHFSTKVSFLEYLLYLSFFPLLLAGPITRAKTFFPQIRRENVVSERLLYSGLWLIVLGIVKKAVVADYIAQYNDWIFSAPDAYSGFECLMGLVGFSMQIYLDFSGYSDISIGIAALLGIRLRENFSFPYRSRNLTEFWHRWHISLSTWFRDYLYIPLGGNRRGTVRTYVNNFITMAVCGLWHGASWMFVFWGAMHGVGLMIHKASKRWLDRLPDHWTIRVASFVLTFTYVAVLWVFFRADSMHTAYKILDSILYDFSWDYFVPFVTRRTTWTIFLVLGYALHAMRERHVERVKEWFVSSPWTFKLIVLLVVLQLVVNFRQNSVQPFIYAQF